MPDGRPFGEYRLLRRIGAGGMAEVFLAKREGPGGFEKQLVIKRILPHLCSSERFTSMFLKEARLAALVDHPNLVHVSSFGEIDGEYYLAMEYVDGLTLFELVQRTGTLTAGVICRIVVDVLEALHAIHNAKNDEGDRLGLVHRDVSPKNVMITKDGAVKLLDFGIAISAEDQSRLTMGTRRYMAPEQLLGEPVDARADLFATAVMLFELFTNRAPFDGLPERMPPRPAEIPDEVWVVLESALALLADGRPRDARTMQTPLELFLSTRGLEGTRAQLADVVTAVSLATPRRPMLARLTQLGQRTMASGDETKMVRSMLIAGLLGVSVVALSTFAWFTLRRPEPTVIESIVAPLPPPPTEVWSPRPPKPIRYRRLSKNPRRHGEVAPRRVAVSPSIRRRGRSSISGIESLA